MNARKLIVFVPAMLLLVRFDGCVSVGPDYNAPKSDSPLEWKADLPPGMQAADLEPEWIASFWKSMNDPALTELINLAVLNNRTLMQAADRLAAARANRGLAYSPFFPRVDLNGSVTDQQTSTKNSYSATTSPDLTTALLQRREAERRKYSRQTIRSAGLDASWEIDLFGGTRRSVEAASADLMSARAAYRDGITSLVAEVALSYIELRTFERRLRIAESNLKAQNSSLELALYRVRAGLSDGLDEEEARLNIEQTKSQIPALRKGIYQTRFNLATLLGVQPEAFSDRAASLLNDPTMPVLPARLVIDLPADAIRRRPDIRMAERKLAAETARIGVRKADLYPKLYVPGSLSYSTTGSTDTRIATIGLRLNWNIFDARAIRRRIDIQKATQSEAFHDYEQTVLSALSEISSALVAFSQEEERRAALVKASGHAEKAAMLTRLKYRTGLVAFSDVLAAEQSLLARQDELAVSEGESIANFIRLYKAMGGGWQSFDPDNDD